jgi:transcriptional regulator with XRE-family HTH domain
VKSINRPHWATNIVNQRERLGMSGLELSKRAKIGISTIRDIERGKAKPSLQTIEAIAEALRIEPYKILMPEGERKSPSVDDFTLLFDFASKFAKLQRDLKVMVLGLVYQDPEILRELSHAFLEQLSRQTEHELNE